MNPNFLSRRDSLSQQGVGIAGVGFADLLNRNGLGSENENLPGFIVFTDYRGGPINGEPNWGNGYMLQD